MIRKVDVEKALKTRKEYLNNALLNIDNIEKIHISINNSKLGIIPSFSVLPLLTCKNNKDCAGYCYACKNYFNMSSSLKSVSENTALLFQDPERVENEINAFLNNQVVFYKYFRWNVSGDVCNENYLKIIVNIAVKNPITKFMLFTKNYELFNGYLDNGFLFPDNLIIIFSRWGNTNINNPHNLPVAITKLNENTFIENGAFCCGGDCMNCLECWHAKNNTFRYFNLH